MESNRADDESLERGGGFSQTILAASMDASKTALLAFGLCIPIVLLRTDQDISNELIIVTRVQLVSGLVAAAYIARFVWLLLAEWHRSRPARAPRAVRADGALVSPEVARRFAIGGLIFLFAYQALSLAIVGPAGSVKWIDNFGIQILIYVMLGWGLNIVVGLAGLLDLGYVAFYAVGAYSYALLASNDVIKDVMAELIGPWFWPAWAFWIGLPVAGILAAFWGIILGFPVLRLRGDYLAIVTLAFGEIIRLVLINWVDVTGGYAGISGIPRPSFFGIPFNASDTGFAATFGLEFTPLHRTIFLFYVILVLALVTNLVTIRLRRLPVGRAWEALREDEIACRSLGINTTNTKLTAFAIGAGFGGFAGAFFAARQNFISPESFTFLESAVILAIVVLGGMGSQIGVAIAAIAMVGGTELLRELDWLKQIFGADFDPAQYRMLIFGLAMVVIMIWRPRGLISGRQPTVFLGERRMISGDLVKEGHG
jgi:branched-chain amino acid transport system permease protein